MKRFVFIHSRSTAIALAVLIALVFFAGCQTTKNKDNTVVYTYENSGRPFKISVSNATSRSSASSVCTVSLYANPSTGYAWSHYVTPSKIITLTEDGFVPDKKSEKLAGASGKQQYSITGLKQGIADAVFTYKRPWEKTQADQRIRIKIRIDRERKIYIQDVLMESLR